MKKLITMLSALTITNTVGSTIVVCNKKAYTQKTDLSKITDDVLINWRSEYKFKDDHNNETVVGPDKLGSLKNYVIVDRLEKNIYSLFGTKITNLDKEKTVHLKEDPFKIDMNNWKDEEIKKYYTFYFTCNAIEAKLKPLENNPKSKAFIATITVKTLNEVTKDDGTVKEKIIGLEKFVKAFLEGSDDVKKVMVRKTYPNVFFEEEELNKKVQEFTRIVQILKDITIDSVKTMYDAIEEQNKKLSIKIDLTSKQ